MKSQNEKGTTFGRRTAFATLLMIVGVLAATVILFALACLTGVGTNQGVTSLAVQSQAYVGMPLDDFCRTIGIPNPGALNDGRFVVSEAGWLSMFVAQHDIMVNFDEKNRLVSAFEVIHCGADENGRQLPLYDPSTGWPSPNEE